jgi:hypothetical protein
MECILISNIAWYPTKMYHFNDFMEQLLKLKLNIFVKWERLSPYQLYSKGTLLFEKLSSQKYLILEKSKNKNISKSFLTTIKSK